MSEASSVLKEWIEEVIPSRMGQQPHALQWQQLSGDAGFRQYFRLNTEPSTLAVLAPPETEDSQAFVAIANYLRDHGLRTPQVIEADLARGFLLIEDFGRDLLLDHLQPENVDVLYGEALMDLLRLQQVASNPEIFPVYSKEKLRTELQVFDTWFVEGLLRYSLSAGERALLAGAYEQLEASALGQPQVIVHRDFHSRNLVYTPGSAPGIIDFQDAVTGPMTYDLVSLLRDCYIHWPASQVQRWALAYAAMAEDVGIIQNLQPKTFLQQFDWMGLQRHIKVLGVFARLSLRDGRHGYLQDLPLVVHYVRSVSGLYPELSEFHGWFEQVLMPAMSRQHWYREIESL